MKKKKFNTKKSTRKGNVIKAYKKRSHSNSASSHSSTSRTRGKGGYARRRKAAGKKPTGIDITTFIQKAQVEAKENKVFEIINTFEDFEFDPRVKKNLKEMGFVTPTPIQDGAIVHIAAGEDIIGLANTGTGKTGAFLLPLISKVLQDPYQKVLIIAPTRELVLQIDNEFREFAKGTKIKSATIIGGVSSSKQIHKLIQKPNFIIGTPGRIQDLYERKKLQLGSINNVVLDEVDRMLDMGFLPPIKEIISKTKEERQTLFFSATMPEPIKQLANQFLTNPITVERQAGRTTSNVEQEIVKLHDETAKFNELKNILEFHDKQKVIIFSETKRSVEKLTEMLRKLGLRVDSIHGDKSQFQRQNALSKFKENKVTVLVATDVAARGLDIKGVQIVINYTIPQTYDDYVHRIGRTGRADSKGKAYTFVTK